MTREEAIKLLTQYIDYDAETPDYYEMEKACKAAIKALEQEPSGDLISRQAVLNAIMANNIRENEYNLTSSRIKKAVENLPPVNPQPKTGHWKRISIDKYSEHAKYWYRCDRCGKDNLGNTDWCPNCGAKMVETQESEDKE